MLITRRPAVTLGLAALVLVSLCACNSSDNPGAPESVQATPSISGTVKVMSGSNA